MGLEYERKYRTDPETLKRLDDYLPGVPEVFHMETTYYDTPDGALSARCITLRHRRENLRHVCTLKLPASGIARREFEVESPSIQAALSALCKLSGFEELLTLTQAGVVPVCGAKFIRRARRLPVGDSTVEVALDAGVLLGGGRETPLFEVEVERLSGASADADLYGNLLRAKFSLEEERASKFRRALALAKGE